MPYIVVEGLDLSGKTSLCKRLAKHYKATTISEPYNQTLISRNAAAAFKDNELGQFLATHLMMLTRIELFKNLGEFTKPENKEFFISDRNFLSTMVYQGKTKKQMEDILELNREVIKNYGYDIFPDIIIVVEPTHRELVNRLEKREDADERDKRILSKQYYHEMSAKYNYSLWLVNKLSKRTVVLNYNPNDGIKKLIDLIDGVISIKNKG